MKITEILLQHLSFILFWLIQAIEPVLSYIFILLALMLASIEMQNSFVAR